MQDERINSWLNTLVKDLPFKEELKSHFQKQGYKNLEEILQHKVSVLMSQPGFTYHMLQDFLEFLKQNNLASQLQE